MAVMGDRIIYIAGPMRGYPRFNVDAFDTAARHFAELGFTVLNPAEMDRKAGFDHDKVPQMAITQDDRRAFMRRDLMAICNCDAIALLPGWEQSKGVAAELALAEFLGLAVFDVAENVWRLADDECEPEADAVPESGSNRQRFDTGAVRSSDANGTRYDLISHIGLRRIAETYADGAAKYGRDNWQKGFPASDVINHCVSHIYQWLGGDTSEDHLAHAAWNLIAAMHFEEARPELIDCYHRQNGGTR